MGRRGIRETTAKDDGTISIEMTDPKMVRAILMSKSGPTPAMMATPAGGTLHNTSVSPRGKKC